jgi:biopolymer transport protein ExbB
MDNLFTILNKGGVLMYPLYLCSFIALVIILAKWVELFWVEHRTKSFVEMIRQLLSKNEMKKIRGLGSKNGSPLERVLYFTKERQENLPKCFELEANEEIDKLGSFLPILAVITRISPLLGLLGTVVGMIQVFYGIELSGGNVNTTSLAGGIWMALLTTVYGLSVAIPVIIFHHYFLRKIERIASQMNNTLERLLLKINED